MSSNHDGIKGREREESTSALEFIKQVWDIGKEESVHDTLPGDLSTDIYRVPDQNRPVPHRRHRK